MGRGGILQLRINKHPAPRCGDGAQSRQPGARPRGPACLLSWGLCTRSCHDMRKLRTDDLELVMSRWRYKYG